MKTEVLDKQKVSLVYTCPKTDTQVTKSLEDISFYTNSGECDLCGSHGETRMDIYDCPSCKGYHEVEVSAW